MRGFFFLDPQSSRRVNVAFALRLCHRRTGAFVYWSYRLLAATAAARGDSFCDRSHERGGADVRLSEDDLTIAQLATDSRLEATAWGLLQVHE
jgi:hypothetical protein